MTTWPDVALVLGFLLIIAATGVALAYLLLRD